MKKVLSVLIPLLCCAALLAGCGCDHVWSTPDCENPARCESCGEYGEAPLGHSWIDPDCVNPAICSTCGKTSSEPLGHKKGESVMTGIDVYARTAHYSVSCQVCQEEVERIEEPLTQLWDQDGFLFTVEEFVEGLNNQYAADGRDLTVQLQGDEDDLMIASIKNGEKEFARIEFASYAGRMLDADKDQRTLAQIVLIFARLNMQDESTISLVPPDLETTVSTVLPVLMLGLPELQQVEANQVVIDLHDAMMQQTGSTVSHTFDRNGITYFLVDSLENSKFGFLPELSTNPL